MERLEEYRNAAFKYLASRVNYLNNATDECLDKALREISDLPNKPLSHDNYNGLLGMRPVVEQRKLCLALLLKRINKVKAVTDSDHLVDKAIRVLNSLPKISTGQKPYVGLFKLPKEKEVTLDKFNPASSYKVSEEGINLIHSFESYKRCTYKDPGSANGKPITGGWGTTRLNGKPLHLGQCYEKKVWDAQFERDLKYFEEAVQKYVKVPITQGMYDALVSFTYNCGVGALVESTVLRRLNNKNYVGAAEALTWWVNGGNGKVLAGLVKRRKAEAELFLK